MRRPVLLRRKSHGYAFSNTLCYRVVVRRCRSSGPERQPGLGKLNRLTVAQISKASPKIQAEMDKLNADNSYSVSSDKISAWAKKNCSITLG